MPVQLATLTGVIPYHAERALRDLAAQGNTIEAGLSTLGARVASLPPVPTMAQIAAALSATGSNPLNTQLLITGPSGSGSAGGSSTRVVVSGGAIIVDTFANRPPVASAPAGALFIASDRGYQTWLSNKVTWTLLPGWGGPMAGTVFTPNARPGGLTANDAGFAFRGTDANDAVWQWNGGSYSYVVGTGFPLEITLNPSTLPTLGPNDAGFPIWSTDFHRLYYWNGSGWLEGEHNDPRGWLNQFLTPPDQHGWVPCNGIAVLQSTSTAGVVSITPPTIAGVYLRV
jgi:hypothetical protein